MPSAKTTSPIHLACTRLLSIMNLKMGAAGSSETLYPPARLLIITFSKSVLCMFHTNILICCHSVAAIHAVLFIPSQGLSFAVHNQPYLIHENYGLEDFSFLVCDGVLLDNCAWHFVGMWHPSRWRWHISSKCWLPLNPAMPCHIRGYGNLWLCHGENLNTHK